MTQSNQPQYQYTPQQNPPAASQPQWDYQSQASRPMMVVVTDLNMPFGSMVTFMIKWALASIPAIIVLSLILGVIFFVLSLFLGGLASVLF